MFAEQAKVVNVISQKVFMQYALYYIENKS